MSYLSREASVLPDSLWEQIDSVVVKAARGVLVGRRFLSVFGPLGIGVRELAVDDADGLREVEKDGIVVTRGRKLVEIPTVYEDFTLISRDLESAAKAGFPPDLSAARRAAEACALREDGLIFLGNAELGYDGLLSAQGTQKIKKGDWSAGENAFSDVAAGVSRLADSGIWGEYSLAVSPDLYLQMRRLQPGTGLLELDRVAGLVDGRLFQSRALGKNRAVLVSAAEANMDLAIGQDLATAYLEQKELNHSFRVLETVLLRIKRRQAIVVFE